MLVMLPPPDMFPPELATALTARLSDAVVRIATSLLACKVSSHCSTTATRAALIVNGKVVDPKAVVGNQEDLANESPYQCFCKARVSAAGEPWAASSMINAGSAEPEEDNIDGLKLCCPTEVTQQLVDFSQSVKCLAGRLPAAGSTSTEAADRPAVERKSP